jgi:hypothetical protein
MASVSGKTIANNLVSQYNVGSNDNKAFSGWTMKLWTTRTVLGLSESKKVIAEVKKLPVSKQKAVLSAIASRIDKKAATVGGMYITPQGAALFKALSDSLGQNKSFTGVQKPPMVMG